MQPQPSPDFETLVELYYQPVFAFAVRLCGRLEHALELTQHTFCLAANHKAYLGEAQQARNWLFTLLFREFLKEKREEARLSSRHIPAVARQAAAKPGAGVRRTVALTIKVLAKMREELRLPLMLFYLKDFSCSQIADYLGIPMGVVLSRLSEGREQFNSAMAHSKGSPPRPLRGPSGRTCRPETLLLAA